MRVWTENSTIISLVGFADLVRPQTHMNVNEVVSARANEMLVWQAGAEGRRCTPRPRQHEPILERLRSHRRHIARSRRITHRLIPAAGRVTCEAALEKNANAFPQIVKSRPHPHSGRNPAHAGAGWCLGLCSAVSKDEHGSIPRSRSLSASAVRALRWNRLSCQAAIRKLIAKKERRASHVCCRF